MAVSTIEKQQVDKRSGVSDSPAAGSHFLVELSRNESLTKPDATTFESVDGESVYEESDFSRQLLGSCKSWLTSMIIHLVVILLLALLTMKTTQRQLVWLEVGTDEFSTLTDLQEINFDTAEFESFDQVDSDPQMEIPEELMSFQPELDLPEQIEAPLEFENPLASETNQLQRLAREMHSDELLAGDSGSSFFGIDASGDSVVYIVDRSGSMQGARWERATAELVESVDSLKSDQKFYVFLFSGQCHPMPQMEGRNQLVTATAENKERFKKWLARQVPDDTTKPLSSVRRALNMRADTIFLLTDGQFYDKTGSYLIRRAELQKNRSEPDLSSINTIAFYCEFELELMLQEIANVNNGTFRSIQ